LNISSNISIEIFGIVSLVFAIILAMGNIAVERKRTKVYVASSSITIAMLVLEISDILIEVSSNPDYILHWKLINALGFSLAPAAPFLLFILYRLNSIKNYILYLTPIGINALICMISLKTGWIFRISDAMQYERGLLFFLPIALSFFYYILLIIEIQKNESEYDKHDMLFLQTLYTLPVAALLIQIKFRHMHLIWPSISLSTLLYYIFLMDLQYKYDTVSGIMNRKAFQKEMELYNKSQDSAAIIVVDLNDLKKINDSGGHKAGDEAILNSATALRKSFSGVGKTFRIGGDEFCVICRNTKEETIKDKLNNLESILNDINKKSKTRLVLAYGYSFYHSKSENIYNVFSEADGLMYEHKAKIKGLYGRRRTDI
jgi:diguanylate cyclase (GGDEF)-like protein